MAKTAFVLGVTLVLSLAAAAGAHGTHPRKAAPLVFVLAGQSNMAGRGLPIPLEKPDRRVLTLTADGKLVPALDPLGDMGEGAAAGPGAGVGPAITFAKTLAAHGRRVILLQCALGGSSASQWLPGQPLFESCMKRARAARRYGNIAGILDIQGETDSMLPDTAPLWAERFEAFVAGAWGHLGRVPIIYGQIGNIRTDTFPYRDQVQAEQAAISIGCVKMIATSDLGLGSDDTHFSAASDVTLGRRFARAMLAMHGCQR